MSLILLEFDFCPKKLSITLKKVLMCRIRDIRACCSKNTHINKKINSTLFSLLVERQKFFKGKAMEEKKREEKKTEGIENVMPELENINRIFSEFNECVADMFSNARNIVNIVFKEKE